MSDAEHVVRLSQAQRHRLENWLRHPNGACVLDRATFESVEDGGVLVRTKEYGPPQPASLAGAVVQALVAVSRQGRDDSRRALDSDVIQAQTEVIVAKRLAEVAARIQAQFG